MKSKINKKKFKKTILFLKNLPWLIGENAFQFFLIMIFLAIIIGGAFFVNRIMLMKRHYKSELSQMPILDENGLNDIWNVWQARQVKIKGTNSRVYPNPFLPKGE